MLAVFDTDHLSILLDERQPSYERMMGRLSSHYPDKVAATIVSFQEQTQGWLGWINKAKRPEQILLGYARLQKLIGAYFKMDVLTFSGAAQDKFEELTKQRVRIGTLDLRIAAIALVNQAMVLTRNFKDFGKVPGLRAEDWTI